MMKVSNFRAFGKVTEGMDIIHKIEEIEMDSEDTEKPVNPPVITSISVETFGVDYGTPKTMEAFDIQNWFNQYYSSMIKY